MRRAGAWLIAAGFGAGLACSLATGAAAQPAWSDAPGWRFNVTTYAWLPTVSGTLRHDARGIEAGGGTGADVPVDGASLLDALRFAAMIGAEARYGRVVIVTDYIYLNLGNESSRVQSVDFGSGGRVPVAAGLDAGTESSIRGSLWTLAGGYTLASGGWGHVEALAGFRILSVSTRTDVRLSADVAGPVPGLSFDRAGRLARDANLIDGIAGLRGRIALGGGFRIPYAVDVGTGSSRVTWQAAGGVGDQSGWAGVTLGYRHLFYDQRGDGLLQDFAFSGPYVAVNVTL
jgi:hypothetical protein